MVPALPRSSSVIVMSTPPPPAPSVGSLVCTLGAIVPGWPGYLCRVGAPPAGLWLVRDSWQQDQRRSRPPGGWAELDPEPWGGGWWAAGIFGLWEKRGVLGGNQRQGVGREGG